VTRGDCALYPPEGAFSPPLGERPLCRVQTSIHKAPFQKHAVQIDHESQGLLVGELPYFPVGFYCRHPLRDIHDLEVTKGFNHIVPFDYAAKPADDNPKGHTSTQLERIREAMDRCAQLGMKVHYDIKLIAQVKGSDQKWEALEKELLIFKDHPALLGWYICDEPSGWGVDKETLEESYRFIKRIDPHHPITIVFYKPKKALAYENALDILVADPYPIPQLPVTMVSDWLQELRQGLRSTTPVWIVPQAFGGGEWWPREPSAQEERVMTYLALIHGAKGIQYFVRVPPMGHPKSPRLWSECQRLALEIAELTPFLLSPTPAPRIRCTPRSIHVSSWTWKGRALVLAANTLNRPQPLRLHLKDSRYEGPVSCLFENRSVTAQWGMVQETLEAFGTRAYLFPLGPIPAEERILHPDNLVFNPSFEEFSNVGTPDGCYFYMGKEDHGSTGFLDSRLSVHGLHSLRLTTASKGEGIRVKPYKMRLEEGQTYRAVLWAKADREGLSFEVQFEAIGVRSQSFPLDTEWTPYTLTGKALETGRHQPTFRLNEQGTAWFDLLQVYPVD